MRQINIILVILLCGCLIGCSRSASPPTAGTPDDGPDQWIEQALTDLAQVEVTEENSADIKSTYSRVLVAIANRGDDETYKRIVADLPEERRPQTPYLWLVWAQMARGDRSAAEETVELAAPDQHSSLRGFIAVRVVDQSISEGALLAEEFAREGDEYQANRVWNHICGRQLEQGDVEDAERTLRRITDPDYREWRSSDIRAAKLAEESTDALLARQDEEGNLPEECVEAILIKVNRALAAGDIDGASGIAAKLPLAKDRAGVYMDVAEAIQAGGSNERLAEAILLCETELDAGDWDAESALIRMSLRLGVTSVHLKMGDTASALVQMRQAEEEANTPYEGESEVSLMMRQFTYESFCKGTLVTLLISAGHIEEALHAVTQDDGSMSVEYAIIFVRLYASQGMPDEARPFIEDAKTPLERAMLRSALLEGDAERLRAESESK